MASAKKDIAEPYILWQFIVFSDKKRFFFAELDKHQSYWNYFEDPPRTFCERQSGGRGLVVWACFLFYAPGWLVLLNINQAPCNYCGMLGENLLNCADNYLGTNWLFR